MKQNTTCFLLLFLGLGILCSGCQNKSGNEAAPGSTLSAPNMITVETTMGSFVIELLENNAPKTTANFIQNVDSGAYNNTIVHEVIKDNIIMIGGFKTTTNAPDSGRIPNEASATALNKKWTVAMLHTPTEIESDSMQFFINMNDNPELDFVAPGNTPDNCGYCMFGKIVAGQDVLEKINQTTVQLQGYFEYAPAPPITISKMSRPK